MRLGLVCPPVSVLKAKDIVFAQIASHLYLNNLQGHGAGVFQPMGLTYGDVCGLVFHQEEGLFPPGNPCGTPHHYPVLGTMMMHLKGEGRTGPYHNPFHLKPRPAINNFIMAPRAVYPLVAHLLRPMLLMELLHQRLYVLHAGLGGNEHGVRGLHHHDLLKSCHRYQPLLGDDERVSG